MSILGNPITLGGGGVDLNIDFGATPPTDTSKLWVPLVSKPDFVKCSPVLNYGSEVISTTQYALPDTMSAGCSGNGAIGKYIYMIAGRKGKQGISTGKISRFNTETGETEDVYTLGDWLAGTFCVVDNKIYCFGGTHKKAFVFDTVSNTLTDLATFPDNYYNYPCCAYYKGNIYIYGGFESSSAYIYQFIRIYNIANNSYSLWNPGITGLYASSAVVVRSKLYIICGRTSSTTNASLRIYDLDSQKYLKSVSLASADSATYGQYAPCCVYGKYIYILCTNTTNGSSPFKVIRYDTETDTGTVVSTEFPGVTNCAHYGLIANKLWVLGGAPDVSSVPVVSSVRTFTIQTNLESNHLFLQADFGFDNPFTVVKGQKSEFEAYLRNAYIGDSNNIAQLTNAYIYDTTTNQWKTLSGESYILDTLNALNIMGVN
jgi:hypothetical protein